MSGPQIKALRPLLGYDPQLKTPCAGQVEVLTVTVSVSHSEAVETLTRSFSCTKLIVSSFI